MFLLWGLLGSLGIAIILPILLYWIVVWCGGNPDPYRYFLFGGWLIILLGIAVFISSICISNVQEKEYYDVPIANIVTLQDGMTVQGSFFLGCGSIEGKPAYMYYTEDSNGCFTFRSILAEDVVIKYTKPGETPRLVAVKSHFKNRELDYWFFESLDANIDYEYIFYVPEGSIKSDYVLDAK